MTGAVSRRKSVVGVTAFRIVKRKFAANAFSGEGARRYGGRWNSIGTPMVYTAGSLSLAVLEWRVHLAQWPTPPLISIEVTFDESFLWIPRKLPAGWDRIPAPRTTAAFGDQWVRLQRSVAMRVPSAVVPQEFNYLLNPVHPEFGRLTVGKPQLFYPDPRLV